MDIKKRKIGFYYLTINGDKGLYPIDQELNRVLEFAMEDLKRKERKYDLNELKFCVLDSYNKVADTRKLIFESARHSYRAPLMDRNNAKKRDNPKKLKEGETLKTHCMVRCKDGDAVLISEITKSGMQVQQIVEYLNYLKGEWEGQVRGRQLSYKFTYETIAKDNFEEELEKLKRVVSAVVHVDKRVLGSDALNFSDRTHSVREEIIMEIKSKRDHSIGHTAVDVVKKFLQGTKEEISKITIVGKNDQENEVKLDTSFIEKREWVRAHLDKDTGEVHSHTMFTEMLDVLNS